MNLVKMIQQIKKIKKTDNDLFEILVEFFQRLSDNHLEKYGGVEIQISRDLWNWDWVYYRNKKTLKREDDYYYLVRDIVKSKGEVGELEFINEHERVYDPIVYEKHVKKLIMIKQKLNKLGFKCKIHYTKNFKKCSLKKEPDSLYMIISW